MPEAAICTNNFPSVTLTGSKPVLDVFLYHSVSMDRETRLHGGEADRRSIMKLSAGVSPFSGGEDFMRFQEWKGFCLESCFRSALIGWIEIKKYGQHLVLILQTFILGRAPDSFLLSSLNSSMGNYKK